MAALKRHFAFSISLEAYESLSSQRDRHVNVQRSLCCEVERTEGQGGTHHKGTRRENGDTTFDNRCVGSWEQLAENRAVAGTCGSPQSEHSGSLAEKITTRRGITDTQVLTLLAVISCIISVQVMIGVCVLGKERQAYGN